MDLLKEMGFGNLITLILAFLGGFASYIGLKGRVSDAEKQVAEAKRRTEDTEKALTEFKLEAARDYVRMTTLRELKDDLTKEIKEVEHVVRNYVLGLKRSGGAG
ncbi:hypothetical protein ACLBYG_22565 [Methylobacterium sp. D53M]